MTESFSDMLRRCNAPRPNVYQRFAPEGRPWPDGVPGSMPPIPVGHHRHWLNTVNGVVYRDRTLREREVDLAVLAGVDSHSFRLDLLTNLRLAESFLSHPQHAGRSAVYRSIMSAWRAAHPARLEKPTIFLPWLVGIWPPARG